jgi:N-acetylglucosaminyl-diphospho-decaprenol L-rhamnosyltransferase
MIQPKVSIVILDFKKSKRVLENVESIAHQNVNFNIEVIIIDNSCDPENAARLKSLEEYHGVQVHINEKNTGYIRGNNLGAKLACGKYLMIVNPDIIWHEIDALQKLVDFMERNPQIGICGPKQIDDTTGKVGMTVRAFPQLPLQIARRTFLRHIPGVKGMVAYDEMKHLDQDRVQTVDWLQSSFWIVRKSVWEELGGLNKDYFIFMSDPDLCFKAWQKGHEVVYYPKVTVRADGLRASEGGIGSFFTKWTLRQHLKEATKYSFKHLFKGNPHERYLDQLEKVEKVEKV